MAWINERAENGGNVWLSEDENIMYIAFEYKNGLITVAELTYIDCRYHVFNCWDYNFEGSSEWTEFKLSSLSPMYQLDVDDKTVYFGWNAK